MAQQIPYKVYKQTDQQGRLSYTVLPGTNTPAGMTESTLQEAQAWASSGQADRSYLEEWNAALKARPVGQTASYSGVVAPWGETLNNVPVEQYNAMMSGNWGISPAEFKAQNAKMAVQPQQPAGYQGNNTPLTNEGATNQQPNQVQQQIQQLQSQLSTAKAEVIPMIQQRIQELQQQVQYAQNAGYGAGGQYAGQDIPENILSGQGYDTGNEQMNMLLDQAQKMFDKMAELGKVPNPDIVIPQDILNGFFEQVKTEFDPYYASQIESIKTDLTKSVENLQKQYDVSKQGAEADFKSSLGVSREQRSGLGTTFSGQRGAAENQMVEAQNRSLDLSALQTEGQLGSSVRQLEGQIGSSNLPTLPQFQTYRASAEGKGSFAPERMLTFTGTGGIFGSLPKEQALEKQKYRDYLEAKYRENQGRTLGFSQ